MNQQNEENFDDLFTAKRKKSGWGKWIALLLVLIFFIALTAVSIDWVIGALVHTRKEVTVPDLTKKNVSEALGLLAMKNLALKQAGVEAAQNVPSGSVLRQIPSAGSTVREGRVIRVWISEGNEMVFVPNTVGSDLRSAQLAIRQAGLLVDQVENAYSVTYDKGLIVSQTPKADSLVQKGEKVSLVLSNGQPPSSVVLVPNFKSKKLAEATLWASSQNINLVIKEDPVSVFRNGTIAAQRPEADSQISPGANFEVTVSRRPISDDEKTYHLHYELPQGKNMNRMRVTLEDATGETEILNEEKQPGSKIDLEIPYSGHATIRIFTDGVLVREREVQ